MAFRGRCAVGSTILFLRARRRVWRGYERSSDSGRTVSQKWQQALFWGIQEESERKTWGSVEGRKSFLKIRVTQQCSDLPWDGELPVFGNSKPICYLSLAQKSHWAEKQQTAATTNPEKGSRDWFQELPHYITYNNWNENFTRGAETEREKGKQTINKNERGNITGDLVEIKSVIREYYEQWYANKSHNLG